jgi:hypothetical protein
MIRQTLPMGHFYLAEWDISILRLHFLLLPFREDTFSPI